MNIKKKSWLYICTCTCTQSQFLGAKMAKALWVICCLILLYGWIRLSHSKCTCTHQLSILVGDLCPSTQWPQSFKRRCSHCNITSWNAGKSLPYGKEDYRESANANLLLLFQEDIFWITRCKPSTPPTSICFLEWQRFTFNTGSILLDLRGNN